MPELLETLPNGAWCDRNGSLALPQGTGSRELRDNSARSLANGLRGHQGTSLSQFVHKGVAMPTGHLVPPPQKELEESGREK